MRIRRPPSSRASPPPPREEDRDAEENEAEAGQRRARARDREENDDRAREEDEQARGERMPPRAVRPLARGQPAPQGGHRDDEKDEDDELDGHDVKQEVGIRAREHEDERPGGLQGEAVRAPERG